MNMMNNLFSIFDPSSYYSTMAWWMTLVPIIMVKQKSMSVKNKMMAIMSTTSNMMMKELKQMGKSMEMKSTSQMMGSTFITLMATNMLAIMPFNFTTTAHMSISMTLSATMWMSTMVNAIKNSTKMTMIHLTPMGTPTALMNFMVMIEVVSNIIRPITLAVRLTANMVAGHLLLSMLSNFSMMKSMVTALSMPPMMVLLSLEMAVAIIQAYVLTTLASLYYKETF